MNLNSKAEEGFQMRVCVIGSGTMGRGLVQVFAQAHFVEKVYVIAQTNSSFSDLVDHIESIWRSAERKNKILESEYLNYKSKIEHSGTYEILGRVDFVIEAVPERIETKKSVFSQIAQHVASTTVVATNTSSLSVTEIASVMHYKENVVGLHFFNPAPVMRLTEVVTGMMTSEAVKQFAYDLSVRLGKTPVYVNEAPGFVVNRMLIPMINEAVGVFSEGVASALDIDTAMQKGANHPIGPLALADLIGNDVCLSIMDVLHSETGDPKYRAHPLLRKMVRAGKLGKKTMIGFFNYQ